MHVPATNESCSERKITPSLAIITNLTHRKVLPSSRSKRAVILSQSRRCRCAQAAISVVRNPSPSHATDAPPRWSGRRRLCRGTPPPLARASLASVSGIIKRDPTGERKLPTALHHHLHQLVAQAPRGVVGNTQMAVQLHRRDPFLAPGHQVDGLEPQGEWQFGRCEDGARVESGDGAPVIGTIPLTAFPVPRSSNRTCGFPASGLPTRSRLRV